MTVPPCRERHGCWLRVGATAALLAAFACPIANGTTAGTADGVLRILLIRLTWNGLPLPERAAIAGEVSAADTFVGRSSFGHLRLSTEITPIIDGFVVPNGCFSSPPGPEPGMGAFADAARAAAQRAGFDIDSYDRFVYLVPERICGTVGLGFIRVVRPQRSYGDRTVLLAAGSKTAVVHGLIRATRISDSELEIAWADTDPPSKPQLLSRSSHGRTLSLVWGAATDDGSGVRFYRLRVDGRVVAEPVATYATLQVPRGRHNVSISAVDQAGLEGSRTSFKYAR